MRLSTRGRFAITAMIDLALREKGYPVPLSDLALRHSISLSYLEQVFAKLRHASLVESTRGPGGGYALSVTDRGKGLPEDFDPTKTKGLGMRIVMRPARAVGREQNSPPCGGGRRACSGTTRRSSSSRVGGELERECQRGGVGIESVGVVVALE